MSKESVENLTRELKDIILKTKKELKNKDDFIKKTKTIQDLTKREYQNLYEENSKLKKKVQQYKTYMKTQQIEKRRREKNEFEKQKKELQHKKKEQDEDISVLSELKKLKRMGLLNYIANKRKEKMKMKMKMNLMKKQKKLNHKKKERKKLAS